MTFLYHALQAVAPACRTGRRGDGFEKTPAGKEAQIGNVRASLQTARQLLGVTANAGQRKANRLNGQDDFHCSPANIQRSVSASGGVCQSPNTERSREASPHSVFTSLARTKAGLTSICS
ncbi:hypothetical protein D3C78_1449740 [compost metagenome]